MNGIWKSRLAVAVGTALLAGCGGMGGMMGSGGGEKVTLSGQNEVPAAATSASGSGTVTVGSDCSVTARVTVTGMSGTAAHIHQAKAGANGPVIVPFTKSGENTFVAPDGAKMNEAQCAAYRAGDTYVNVHSDKFKGGEVRAQLKGH
jgi:CHRD domain-containing protein